VTQFLIDTNVPSELTRDKPDARVTSFLRSTDRHSMFLSVMTLGEICKGIASLRNGEKKISLQHWMDRDLRTWFSARVLPVTENIAERWGHLAAKAMQRGSMVPVVDGLIAATAIEHGLTVLTRNEKDFSRLEVEIFNPWDA